ncbi:Dps family protein [Plantactinospora sp. KBS50]|uniref:Dps family protein n=1 Tax=Plantactinospora sp. KBS50 TaxID=2024580 RepID=UPI000BAB0F15|nr:DNA starvation/stationary phase protection protein [Plantactinospora sp. KBS50]ASW57193.1 DNA starvation/stationary phase protection protein [Plantactinospora sp. KBS50]
MATINSVLEPDARDVTAAALQQTLVDLIDLGLVAKQAHWTVTGPRFRSLHQQLDEVVDTARVHADTIAERCAAIGVAPNGLAATVAHLSRVPQPPSGWENDDDVVSFFTDAYARVIAGLRERVTEVGYTDPVSQDLLIAVTADLEKQYWMFQAERR